MAVIDETHDPALRSWVVSANDPETDFPIQNLPLGVFEHSSNAGVRLGTAIGEYILDISPWLEGKSLNGFFELPSIHRRDLRAVLSKALCAGSPEQALFVQSECRMRLPAFIGDFTDFYASIHHASNVGSMFRPDNPLLPNYKHLPIAYHGRSSSIVVSGAPIRRPLGQLAQDVFAASSELDYEVEVGAFIGPGNSPGEAIPVNAATEHLAAFCLLNDWSARDIQRWEYQPLGPFLAKNFATTISPWVITAEALEPFRISPVPHETLPLPYLQSQQPAAFDITLEAWLRTPSMRRAERLSRASFREMYWTFPQMIAHHTSNGCPLRPGDLIASGTVSGPLRENCGCLLELTWKGKDPLVLSNGERRNFLQDGDEVALRGHCVRDGYRRIGFGSCSGTIVPAQALR